MDDRRASSISLPQTNELKALKIQQPSNQVRRNTIANLQPNEKVKQDLTRLKSILDLKKDG
jgi:hypothetical protein